MLVTLVMLELSAVFDTLDLNVLLYNNHQEHRFSVTGIVFKWFIELVPILFKLYTTP